MSENRQPTPPSSGGGGTPAACTTGICPTCTCLLDLSLQSADTSGSSSLADTWFYVKRDSAITRYRVNSSGRVQTLNPGGDAECKDGYGRDILFDCNDQIQVYYSRGAKPIPYSELNACTDCFFDVTLRRSGSEGGNTVCGASIPPLLVNVTLPAELSLWLQLWEQEQDDYLTRGINQGGALWTSTTGPGSLTVTESGQANQPGPDRPAVAGHQVRPRERGLLIQGIIDARATGVKVSILSAAGNRIQLLTRPDSTAAVTEIDATLSGASGNTKPFEAVVYFHDSAAAFGPVKILVRSQGISPHPVIGAYSHHLAGLQVALVDDRSANANGTQRGPVIGESDEVNVVDFLNSPQASLAAISGEARARRMISYRIDHRTRNFSATNPSPVLRPEMPMWMAECHVVGITRVELENLMKCRRLNLSGNPREFEFALSWRVHLSWDGPDSGTTSARRYQYMEDFTTTQSITLRLDAHDRVDGVQPGGAVINAFSPAPPMITFPVTGRRSPQVVVDGQRRSWGRCSAATSRETILIEWQPHIVDAASSEIIRGGDGVLSLDSLSATGNRVHGGKVPTATGFTDPPTTAPDGGLPRFRVIGINPPSPANAIINAAVEDHYNTNSTAPRVLLLSLACWQETVRRILAHEAGHQFDHRGAGRRQLSGTYYGHEGDMPIFGPPHGYGYGQHDNPRVNDDGAWSFFENIKESVRRIMEDKAQSAYNHISGHMPSPANQRIRAVYQREIVRRYNGGAEFTWNGSDWVINPSLACTSDRLGYPNNVLGTSVTYFTMVGGTKTCSWPITFVAGQFGPGT